MLTRLHVSSVALCGSLCLLLVFGCSDDGKDAQKPNSFGDFVSQRIQTINSGDRDGYVKTIHPAVRTAMAEENPDYFDKLVADAVGKKIPADMTTHEIAIPPGSVLLFEGTFSYPVRPTHAVIVKYNTEPTGEHTRIWQAVKDERAWYWITGVPAANSPQESSLQQSEE